MLRPYLLVFLFFAGTYAISCPAGYSDNGNGVCQSPKINPQSQFDAYNRCAADNAYLLDVKNGFENSNVGYATGGKPLWLGLTCTSSRNTSCLWDNGAVINASSYSNFAPGHPNPNIGSCVVINSTNYQWYSSSCLMTYSYICRITPGINMPVCPAKSYYFHGKCYFPMADLNLTTAIAKCNASCGNIASIHSAGENSYVRDVALFNRSSPYYTYIGLSCSSDNCTWSDGTKYNYNAFGYKNPSIGSCVFLATSISEDIVPQGQWMSINCNEKEIAICKKDLNCPAPTQSSGTCTGTQYFSGSGEIKSPGYPYGAVKNHCQYMISQPTGYGVKISFPELTLDNSSTIKIYNDVVDPTPIVTLTNESHSIPAYFSSGNLLRIVFDTPGDLDIINTWRASFDSYKCGAKGSNDCGGFFCSNGSVVGPHSAQNCTYTFKIGTNKTCLRFTSYGVMTNDFISIYDGEVAPENNIAYISHNGNSSYPYQQVVLCSSTSNYLNLVTLGRSGLTYDMFTMLISDSSDSIKGPSYSNGYNQNTWYLPKNYSMLQTGQGQTAVTSNDAFYAYYSSQKVKAELSYLIMPDPSNILILDGYFDAPVALAYGNPTRRTYYSTQYYLTMTGLFREPTPLLFPIGYNGTFTGV